MRTLKLYYLDEKYIDYLRQFDSKVPYNKNRTRPFVGVVYSYNNFNYFAPLSSPKPKHLKMNPHSLDIFKLDNGKLGIVNLNNMIPTPEFCLTEVLPLVENKQYKILLKNQLTELNNKKRQLMSKTKQFQMRVQKGHVSSSISNRCCNFKLLEEKCLEYEKNVLIS